MENNIFFCDLETTNPNLNNGISYPFLGGIWYNDNFNCVSVSSIDSDFFSIFFNKIVSLIDNKNDNYIYFYNLKFDCSYILNWLVKKQKYTQVVNFNVKYGNIVVGKNNYKLIMGEGKIYELSFKWKNVLIIIRDLMKLTPNNKLEKLGDALNIKKLVGSVDYSTFNFASEYPIEWIEYLKRDCEIMARTYDFLKEVFQVEPLDYCTIGAIGKNKIWDDVINNTSLLNINDYYHYDESYRGGLTIGNTFNKLKWVSGNIKMVDVVSMYPSIMCEDLPYKSEEKSDKTTRLLKIKISNLQIKAKYKSFKCMPRPYRKHYNYKKRANIYQIENEYDLYVDRLYYNESAIYWFWENELEILKQLYNFDYEIIEEETFYLKPYLKNIVNYWYGKKEQFKNEGNKPKTLISKLLINSMYGKLGQKPEKAIICYGSYNPFLYDCVGEVNKNIGYVKGVRAIYIMKKRKYIKENECAPIYLASYITSQARVKLMKEVKSIIDNGGTFLYCDTDSIIYKGDYDPKIGSNLGDWEVESKIKGANLFCYQQPKNYRICQDEKILKQAVSGASVEEMNKIPNNLYNKNMSINITRVKNNENGVVFHTSTLKRKFF